MNKSKILRREGIIAHQQGTSSVVNLAHNDALETHAQLEALTSDTLIDEIEARLARLEGGNLSKRILVTGASRGIGRAVVEAILARSEGHVVYAGYRDLAAASSLLALGAVPIQLDVTDSASIEQACSTLRLTGQLDVLINNAGVLLERDGCDLTSIVLPTIRINVQAQIAVTEAVMPLIRDSGHIINVSSAAGTRSFGALSQQHQNALMTADAHTLLQLLIPIMNEAAAAKQGGTPIYGLSKAALNCYTQLLARENPRLQVNACSPGFCRSEIGGADVVYTTRQPKPAALGASVVVKLALDDLAAGQSGCFYKERSKPDTPLDQARSGIEAWVA